MNNLKLIACYKAQRHLYLALKHMIDAEVEDLLLISDKVGTSKALELENEYHLTTIRLLMHKLYKQIRYNRQSRSNESVKQWELRKKEKYLGLPCYMLYECELKSAIRTDSEKVATNHFCSAYNIDKNKLIKRL